MISFPIHDKVTASEQAQSSLDQAEKKFGRIPNLIGGLAEAPIAAEAYLKLGELVNQSSLSPDQRHVVWFTVNAYHDCHYCMAAHTAIAHAEQIDAAVIDSARKVEPYDDPQLEALRRFTLSMVENRGSLDEQEVDEFIAAGFTRQNVLEIVTIIAHKVISNYSNHLINTPVDGAFAKFAWAKPETVMS